jgi:hypothetical protein
VTTIAHTGIRCWCTSAKRPRQATRQALQHIALQHIDAQQTEQKASSKAMFMLIMISGVRLHHA